MDFKDILTFFSATELNRMIDEMINIFFNNLFIPK